VLIGIVAKLLIHWARGVSPKNMLRMNYRLERQDAATWIYHISGSAIFSNFISLKTELSELPDGKTIIFDLSEAYLIDHTVMELIDQFRLDYLAGGGQCEIRGLEDHAAYGDHELAARRLKP
jgi:MFS superfamily sulfate permease-like transporter